MKIGGHISDLRGRFLQSLIREARAQMIRGECAPSCARCPQLAGLAATAADRLKPVEPAGGASQINSAEMPNARPISSVVLFTLVSIAGEGFCAEVQVNLAYRWFCKLGIEDSIPTLRCSAAHGTNAFARATPCAGFSRAWWRSASRPDLLADDIDACLIKAAVDKPGWDER